MAHPELTDPLTFRRSSFCAKDACVEVAIVSTNEILVRDGKDARVGAPVLRFDAAEWSAFLSGVAAGEFS